MFALVRLAFVGFAAINGLCLVKAVGPGLVLGVTLSVFGTDGDLIMLAVFVGYFVVDGSTSYWSEGLCVAGDAARLVYEYWRRELMSRLRLVLLRLIQDSVIVLSARFWNS